MCYNSQVGSELVMKIIVSAGGTGGHLYPALALVDYIKTQDKNTEFFICWNNGSFRISSCSTNGL